jgi:hypothetical protein
MNYGYIVLVHTTRRILIGFSLLEIPKVAKPVILEGTPGIARLRTFLGRHVASKRSYRTAKGSIWPFFQRLRCQLCTQVRSSHPELWAAEAQSHTTQQSTSTNPEYNQSWRKRTSRPLSRLKLLKFLLQAEDKRFYCQRCFYMNSWISRAFPRARARKATFTVLFGVLEVT